MNTGDRLAIHEVIALHGLLIDDQEWDRLDEVFTDDVILDLADFGYGILHSLADMQQLIRDNKNGEGTPRGHHVTNIVVTKLDGTHAQARSKALVVMPDGTTGTAVYEDSVRHDVTGWRICARKVASSKAH